MGVLEGGDVILLLLNYKADCKCSVCEGRGEERAFQERWVLYIVSTTAEENLLLAELFP